MKALILAGGYATRLRPLSYALPKLLFPIVGTPILERTITHLSEFDVQEVILAVNYMADELRRHFGVQFRGVTIKYSLDPEPLGTGGPIAHARKHLEQEDVFLVMNGDIVADIDLRSMRKKHMRGDSVATIALYEVRDPSRFGVVRFDRDERIRDFVEKPRAGRAPSRFVNAGVYLMKPDIFGYIPEGRKVIIEKEVFPNLARERRLQGFKHGGYWFDIGDLSDYRLANWALLESFSRSKPKIADTAKVEKSARVVPPAFVGHGVEVNGGAQIGPHAIVGDHSVILSGAKLRSCILFDHVKVGERSKIEGSIVGGSSMLGSEVVARHGCVISGHVVVKDGVKLARNVIVHPYKEVQQNVLKQGHVM